MKLKAAGLFLGILVLATVLTVTAGCGRTTEVNMPDEETQADTVTVIDSFGREVDVPINVERVATLYAFTGHVTTLLGKGDLIVATNRGLKRDILFNRINPVIADAVMPSSADKVNIEELLTARPDLVMIQGNMFRDKKEQEKLDKSLIPYLAVDYNSIEGQLYAVEMIGRALGATEAAERYLDYYRGILNLVGERVKDIPDDKKVRVYHSVNEATRTYGRDNLAADWTLLCGAVNVALDQPLRLLDNNYFAGLEQILLWDPDIIITNEDGVAGYIMSNQQWSPLKAVKTGRVYQMPVGVSRWGHPGSLETPLGILYAAKLFYPEQFTDIDIAAEARNFYRNFFKYELTDEELQNMLKGQGMREAK
jgi:iron complex transport system substrate-binding protein